MDAEDGIEHARVMLRTSADPRAERTRARIFGAAQRLCAVGRTFSVSELARESGVSRSVFYTHFADLGDVALRMQEPHFAAIAAQASVERDADPERAMLESQLRLVAHFDAHRPLYRAALQLPGRAVAERIAEAMRMPIQAHVQAIGGAPHGLRSDLVAAYVASAATHLIEQWLLDELDVDAQALARHLHFLMPSWMHEAPTDSTTASSSSHRRKEAP